MPVPSLGPCWIMPGPGRATVGTYPGTGDVDERGRHRLLVVLYGRIAVVEALALRIRIAVAGHPAVGMDLKASADRWHLLHLRVVLGHLRLHVLAASRRTCRWLDPLTGGLADAAAGTLREALRRPASPPPCLPGIWLPTGLAGQLITGVTPLVGTDWATVPPLSYRPGTGPPPSAIMAIAAIPATSPMPDMSEFAFCWLAL